MPSKNYCTRITIFAKKTEMELKLGFSTCPNDTFIFDALVNGKIESKGLKFNVLLADVEELNREAARGVLHITKLSYHAYAGLADQYLLLDAGSALGKNNGPLLISKKKIYPDEVNDLKIAIPGLKTTANLLLSIAYPLAKNKKELLFSDIEDAVLDSEFDAGLIIHENRFTYQEKGLKKIVDLGEFWEQTTQSPIPLGGIAIHRSVPKAVQLLVQTLLVESIEHAWRNPDSPYLYMRRYAQEMDESVMRKHIELYVNQFTKSLGNEGRKAIRTLFDKATDLGLVEKVREDIFVV